MTRALPILKITDSVAAAKIVRKGSEGTTREVVIIKVGDDYIELESDHFDLIASNLDDMPSSPFYDWDEEVHL